MTHVRDILKAQVSVGNVGKLGLFGSRTQRSTKLSHSPKCLIYREI
jgi:hypothetical protein